MKLYFWFVLQVIQPCTKLEKFPLKNKIKKNAVYNILEYIENYSFITSYSGYMSRYSEKETFLKEVLLIQKKSESFSEDFCKQENGSMASSDICNELEELGQNTPVEKEKLAHTTIERVQLINTPSSTAQSDKEVLFVTRQSNEHNDESYEQKKRNLNSDIYNEEKQSPNTPINSDTLVNTPVVNIQLSSTTQAVVQSETEVSLLIRQGESFNEKFYDYFITSDTCNELETFNLCTSVDQEKEVHNVIDKVQLLNYTRNIEQPETEVLLVKSQGGLLTKESCRGSDGLMTSETGNELEELNLSTHVEKEKLTHTTIDKIKVLDTTQATTGSTSQQDSCELLLTKNDSLLKTQVASFSQGLNPECVQVHRNEVLLQGRLREILNMIIKRGYQRKYLQRRMNRSNIGKIELDIESIKNYNTHCTNKNPAQISEDTSLPSLGKSSSVEIQPLFWLPSLDNSLCMASELQTDLMEICDTLRSLYMKTSLSYSSLSSSNIIVEDTLDLRLSKNLVHFVNKMDDFKYLNCEKEYLSTTNTEQIESDKDTLLSLPTTDDEQTEETRKTEELAKKDNVCTFESYKLFNENQLKGTQIIEKPVIEEDQGGTKTLGEDIRNLGLMDIPVSSTFEDRNFVETQELQNEKTYELLDTQRKPKIKRFHSQETGVYPLKDIVEGIQVEASFLQRDTNESKDFQLQEDTCIIQVDSPDGKDDSDNEESELSTESNTWLNKYLSSDTTSCYKAPLEKTISTKNPAAFPIKSLVINNIDNTTNYEGILRCEKPVKCDLCKNTYAIIGYHVRHAGCLDLQAEENDGKV